MVKSQDILNGLQSIVDNYQTFAILWHVAFYLLIGALFLKWEPSNKTFAFLVALPLLSVAVFAWLTGNPFNGLVYSLATILLVFLGMKADSQQVQYSQVPFIIAGIMMIAFGLLYPHFISHDNPIRYLYESPVGLIPCPTLSLIIGFLLLYNGFNSQPVTLTLIILGLFYGIFGVLKLGVYLDLILLVGAITLLAKYIMSLRSPAI